MNTSATNNPKDPDLSLFSRLRQETTDVDLQVFIKDFLSQYNESTQLDILINMFDEALDSEAHLHEAVVTAWTYLESSQVYRTRFQTLQQFKTTINFSDNIEPIIKESEQQHRRLRIAHTVVFQAWGIDIISELPPDIQPPRISRYLAEAIAKFSRTISYQEALPFLRSAIQTRLNTPWSGKRNISYLSKQDVDRAYKKHKASTHDSLADTSRQHEYIPNLHDHSMYSVQSLINYLDTPSPRESEADTTPEIPDLIEQQSSGNETDPDDDSTSPPPRSKSRGPARCKCPPELKTLTTQLLNGSNNNIARIQLFVAGINLGIHRMCRSDLRNFVKHSISLLNNVSSEEIISRARLAFEHRASLDQFRNTNYSWFARSAREIALAELLEPFRFQSNTNPDFTFDALAVMERFAGHNAAQQWDRDGNLLIPNLLNYIRQDRQLYEMIGQEFDMYEHHFQPHTSKPKMGFLRNMFFSLTQQLVRQDPAWYALNAACRPSHDWRLISYPYVAKKVVPGERTGFAHTDVNIAKWVEYGHGANQLTSSVSLDYEKPTDCTEIVPGFHHHAVEWYNRLVKRGTEPTGTTTNAVKLYLPEDEQSFGSFQPQVCGPGDVRITRPEIIHGSTPNATIPRRVIYPWFTAIKEDHHTLEIPGQLSWGEVAACHRDMLAPRSGVGGDTVSFSCPVYRFAAGIHMPSSSALSDALIGRRSWEDPEVLLQRDILLGANAQASHDYVRRTRKELVKNFKTSFHKMVSIEQSAFGTNSFFAE